MITTRLMTVVLILGNLQETIQGPCLSSSCSPEDDLNTCLSGDWQCNINEFCEIVIHDKISLNCKDTEHELQHCQQRSASDSDICVIPTLPSEHPCHYCCEDDQCVRNLSETGLSITEEPIPAHHSCYSSSCLHGYSLNTCSSGQWACQDNEFCEIVIHDMISLKCKHTEPELQHCQERSNSDSDICVIPTVPSEHPCNFCCEDDQCVRNLSETVVSITEEPIPAHHSCYSSSCLQGDSLNTCSSGQWACQDDEFCEIVIHDMISLKCKHTEPELQHCQERSDSDSDICVIPTVPSEHPCNFCCEDDQCVRNLSETVVSITEEPIPAHHSCYSSSCLQGDSLNTCSSGQWTCQDDEFCEIVIHDMISLKCKHTEPELQHCQERSDSDSDICVIPTVPSEHPCNFCCEDDQCVRNLSETVVSITEEPIPAHHSCYSSSCLQGDSLNTCSSGQWTCQDDEFCEIVIHDMISLKCKHTEPELQHCQERSDSDSDICVIPTVPSEHPCNFCCEDDQCVRNLSETVVSITEEPIPAHHSCYSSSCLQGDSLNTCSSGQWTCQDDEFCEIVIHDMISLKCKHTEPELQHCQTKNAKNHEACDPAVIPSAQACHYCCENDLCVQDMTSSNQGLLSSATTLITALPTTLPTFGGIQCVQCGDYDLNVPCTTMELLLDSTTECTVPGQNFCMTDAATDSDGVTTYIKRCVNRDTCHTLWYLESSDQNVCRNFDESTPDVSCHFCCVEEGCNISILPAENTLYNGHR